MDFPLQRKMISSRSKNKNKVASLSAYVSGGAYLRLPENRFIEMKG